MTASTTAYPSVGGYRAAARPAMRQLRFDVGTRPFLVLLELTRSCGLACRHCRADAGFARHPDELRTNEVRAVLDDLAALGPPRPIVVFTGGDPLCRPDLVALVRHGAASGLSMAVSPAGTPRARRARLVALRRAGARTVSFSLDGGGPCSHDAVRGVAGSFAWTLAGCRAAQAVGMRIQVNTTVSTETVSELPMICRLVTELGANLWSVFFLVPAGRARSLRALSADETEDVLHFLADVGTAVPLKTTEAPQFRRILLQRARQSTSGATVADPGPLYVDLRRRLEACWPEAPPRRAAAARTTPTFPWRSPLAVGDGRGVVFVSHCGDVSPSGFLPLVAGNVRTAPVTEIYAGSDLFRRLRDPAALSGRCGRCEFGGICGGSRAQAFAASGDPLGEDPTCAYVPRI